MNSGFQILIKDKYNLSNFGKTNNIDSKSESFKKFYSINKNQLNLDKNKLTKKGNNNSVIINNIIENHNKMHNSFKNSSDSNSIYSSMRKKFSERFMEIKNNKLDYHPLKKQNFSWNNYFFYIITCKLKDPKIRYFEYFRKEVITEENLIQNYINIFKLLKVCKIDIFEPFKLKKNISQNIY